MGPEKSKRDDSEVTLEDLESYMKDGNPRCPLGGECELYTVEDHPTCTVVGHTIDSYEGEEAE